MDGASLSDEYTHLLHRGARRVVVECPLKIRFAVDSPLEGDGFELPVPLSRNGRPVWPKGIEVKGRSIEEIDEQFARQTPTGVQAGHAAGT